VRQRSLTQYTDEAIYKASAKLD